MTPRPTPLSGVSAHRPGEAPRADVVWASARARNALRQPGRLIGLALLLSVAVMALLVFLPRQAQRAVRTMLPDESEWRDTVPLAESLTARRATLDQMQGAFIAARDSALRQQQLASAPPPPLAPEQRARRDSLARISEELARALERVQAAPLLPSYRTLGESEALRNVPAVRAVLDSLADVERQREPYGTEGGADPVYGALTARANDLGRRLQAAARDTLAAARELLDRIEQPRVARHPMLDVPRVDTLAPLARLTAAREQAVASLDSLEIARVRNRDYARQLASARRSELAAAPPLAVLAAGLVSGIALAYLMSFLKEVRRPRIGGLLEVERITGSRVLAVAGPLHEVPEWNRRRSDMESRLHLVQPASRAYRTLYTQLSATGATIPIVTVTGPEPDVNGVIGVNLAVAAATEGRGTLLVDLDPGDSAATRVLRLPLDPGVVDVRGGRLTWPEAVTSIPVGRDRLLDVITSGASAHDSTSGRQAGAGAAHIEGLRRALTRMARRYDLAVLVASLEETRRGDSGLIALPDVLICARVGATTHAELREAVQDARGGGLRVCGLVLWDGPLPMPPAALEGHHRRPREPHPHEGAGATT